MSYERLLAARRHIDERRFREAIVELHVVLENETKPSQAEETLELLALANFKAAHLTEAERLARQLISSQPTNAYAHTILVRSLERQSRHEEAVGQGPWWLPSEPISDPRVLAGPTGAHQRPHSPTPPGSSADFSRTLRVRYCSSVALGGRMVGIAQLVEHLVVVQDVAGSNPVTHPKEGRARCASVSAWGAKHRVPRE